MKPTMPDGTPALDGRFNVSGADSWAAVLIDALDEVAPTYELPALARLGAGGDERWTLRIERFIGGGGNVWLDAVLPSGNSTGVLLGRCLDTNTFAFVNYAAQMTLGWRVVVRSA